MKNENEDNFTHYAILNSPGHWGDRVAILVDAVDNIIELIYERRIPGAGDNTYMWEEEPLSGVLERRTMSARETLKNALTTVVSRELDLLKTATAIYNILRFGLSPPEKIFPVVYWRNNTRIVVEEYGETLWFYVEERGQSRTGQTSYGFRNPSAVFPLRESCSNKNDAKKFWEFGVQAN